MNVSLTKGTHRVAIIGGGPAGMIAAWFLAEHFAVDLYEQGRNVGRKFLVAGDGGLNITNSAEGTELLNHYAPQDNMRPIIEAFGSAELRVWLQELGVPTFIGSSGRVFPERGIKPAEVLKIITDALEQKGVNIHTHHRFAGFDAEGRPIIEYDGVRIEGRADRTLFALGGASWPKTGSTGEWTTHFNALGVHIVPFQASNCGIEVKWPEGVRVHAGKPLKNILVSAGASTVRGEVTITENGLEGNAIYPIVPRIREALAIGSTAEVIIDLKPDLTVEQVEAKLRDTAWKERLAALRLDRPSVALMKAFTPVQRYLDGRTLPYDVKHVRIPVQALRPIEEAISTVGGISMDEVDAGLALKMHPYLFVAGEMLDWDAPTGGFLLQGAFSTGRWAARSLLERS